MHMRKSCPHQAYVKWGNSQTNKKMSVVIVLVSLGCYNQVPRVGSLTVLEPGSPKPRCQQGQAPSEGSRAGSFLASLYPLVVAAILGVPWLVYRSVTPSATSIFTSSLSPLCLCVSLHILCFLIHQSFDLGSTLIQ